MYKRTKISTKGESITDRKRMLLQLCESWLGEYSGCEFYCKNFAWLAETDFFTAPASTKHHAAYPGGLFDHCMNVTLELLHMTDKGVVTPWNRDASPLIIGILHDTTKIGKYKLFQDMNTVTQEVEPMYVTDKDYPYYGGHGYDSAVKALQHIQLTVEEEFCIRFHMGAYETEEWDAFDSAIKKFPNVLWTHTADMVASKLMED